METVCPFAAARGTASRGTCARLSATGTSRRAATATWASGSPGYNPLLFITFTILPLKGGEFPPCKFFLGLFTGIFINYRDCM